MENMTRTARIVIAGLVLCVAAAPQAAAPPAEPPKTAPATHVTKDQIQEFIAKPATGQNIGQSDPGD